ncbi:MAG: hypothetical protein C0597_00130, partial [Marinilabiliales bacterium]
MKESMLLSLLFLMVDCSPTPQKQIEGKWMMHKIIQDGDDVTDLHNPFQERFVIMKEDGSFESDGRPYGKNTGKY